VTVTTWLFFAVDVVVVVACALQRVLFVCIVGRRWRRHLDCGTE
jgi:hypothetical protein